MRRRTLAWLQYSAGRKTAPFFRGLRLPGSHQPRRRALSEDRPVLQGIETIGSASVAKNPRRKTAPFFRGLRRHGPVKLDLAGRSEDRPVLQGIETAHGLPASQQAAGRKTAPFFRGLRLKWWDCSHGGKSEDRPVLQGIETPRRRFLRHSPVGRPPRSSGD